MDADFGLLGMYFDAVVVEVQNNLILFRLALAILWQVAQYCWPWQVYFSLRQKLQAYEAASSLKITYLLIEIRTENIIAVSTLPLDVFPSWAPRFWRIFELRT